MTVTEVRKLKRVVVKEELVALTQDVRMAILLNQMIYWSERVKDAKSYLMEERQRKENEDKEERTSGWIYKKASELVEETMLGISETTVHRLLDKLIQHDWLDVRTNPLYGWDRTKQYRVNLLQIEEDLHTLGYSLQGYLFEQSNAQTELVKTQPESSNMQSDNSNHRNESSGIQHERAIPEITSEITTREDNEKVEQETHIDTHSTQAQQSEYMIQTIEDRYIQLRGKGLYLSAKDMTDMYEICNSDISHEQVIEWMEQCFANYQPRYTGDRIASFAYVKQYILQQAYVQKSRQDAKTNAQSITIHTKPRTKTSYPTHKERLPEWFDEHKQECENKQQTESAPKKYSKLEAEMKKKYKSRSEKGRKG
ncbi:hypothetical protein [Bacillus solimangrovi]|uniref:DnaD domain-containing protein n=1 Tax=Bacillus solimangrovi TaxID=1305675 RepID=A0A1E5LAF8_9BACI|nr:hypothetical protein [Bacillus solimangrovi]OEH91087.1 hypothetical protein BFG57_06870 [Bacillus solimangrovi]